RSSARRTLLTLECDNEMSSPIWVSVCPSASAARTWSSVVENSTPASNSSRDNSVQRAQVLLVELPIACRDVGRHLLRPGGACDNRRHGGLREKAADSHLQQGSAAFSAELPQRVDLVEQFAVGAHTASAHARISGWCLTASILASQETVGQRERRD